MYNETNYNWVGKLDSTVSASAVLCTGWLGETPAVPANTLIVKNVGNSYAYVALGDATVVAVYGSGTQIAPQQTVTLPIGGNTNIAAIGSLVEVLYTIQ
jgi:hypothetical protein